MVSAAKINTGSLVRFGLGPDRPHVLCMGFYPVSLKTRLRMTGGKCLDLFIDPYSMCNQR